MPLAVGQQGPIELDRRCSARAAMQSHIHLRRVGGASFQVQLHDLSTSGCRVELIEEPDVDETVITRFPQLEPIGAKVRWAKSTVAGVEFVRPIHPAVLDQIVVKLRAA